MRHMNWGRILPQPGTQSNDNSNSTMSTADVDLCRLMREREMGDDIEDDIVTSRYFLTYMKSCSVNSEVTKVKKQLIALDSLANKRDLEIEGLKAEKRMIQATDRKMLDVQRQSEIDVELKKLGAH